MTTLWLIVLCGVLALVYAIWATTAVMRADAGSEKMQEIAAAIRERITGAFPGKSLPSGSTRG